MRSADVQDSWRRLELRQFGKTLDELIVANLRGIAQARVKFGGGLTALCGPNGAGKTTLLQALHLVLDLRENQEAFLGTSSAIARVEAVLSVGQEQQRRTWPRGAETENAIQTTWIDSGSYAPLLRRSLIDFGGVDDQLSGIEPREASKEELEDLQYVVGRYYSSVKTYEVDLGEEDPVPYFVCESGGVRYRLEEMGQGELSAHLLLWSLHRAPAQSIVLLEEPETFLAPRSQSALLDVLARVSQKKSISVVLSTHSEAILRRLPVERVRLVTRTEAGVRVSPVGVRATYLTVLGVPAAPRCVVLVEDRVALILARALIARCAFDALGELAFEVVKEGESGICELLKRWPGGAQVVVGLFDGDQRPAMARREARNERFSCGYAFLPGDASPEVMLRRVVIATPQRVAEELGVSDDVLQIALALAEGRDLHDWLHVLATNVNVTIDTLIVAVVGVWLEDAAVKEELVANVAELVKLARSNGGEKAG